MKLKIMKTVMTAVFLITANIIAVNAKPKTQEMSHPDFALPKTVQQDSRKQLENALKNHKPEEALRAFMNLMISTSLISTEEAIPLINELDTMCLSLPAPYNALGYMLEAQIYKEIYRSDTYTFNQRTVSPEMGESNPLLWDRRLFANKIISLVDLALSEESDAAKMPLSKIKTLIEEPDAYKDFTVYDFLVYKSLNLTEGISTTTIIPFFKEPEKKIDALELVDRLLELHPSPSPARLQAIEAKAELLQGPEKEKFLWNELLQNEKSALAPRLAVFYFNNGLNAAYGFRSIEDSTYLEKYKELYKYVKYLRQETEAKGKENLLDSLMSTMAAWTVSLKFPDIVRTGEEFKISVQSTNASDFYLLLLDTKGTGNERISISKMEKVMEKVATAKVSIDGEIPFYGETEAIFKIDRPGDYTVISSRTPEIKDMIEPTAYFYPTLLKASDIDMISYSRIRDTEKKPAAGEGKKRQGCFVVNAADGAPIEGATVIFSDQRSYIGSETKEKPEKVISDKEGFAATPKDNAYASCNYKGSTAQSWTNVYTMYNKEGLKIAFFTDRAVYRPGDTLRFTGIAYKNNVQTATLYAEKEILVFLDNPNRMLIDTLKLKTDKSGRFVGEYKLPQDGLLGTWRLWAENQTCSFSVAEYKVPSLLVTLEKSGADADSITLKGKATTYTGMPIADSEVAIQINYRQWDFFRGGRNADSEFATTTRTDAEGDFEISLPLDNLSPKEYTGIFFAKATVTDNAGETAESPEVRFWLSEKYTIDCSVAAEICLDTLPYKLTVAVKDVAGLPVIKKVRYEIQNEEGTTVSEGEFDSPTTDLDLSNLPSGKYKFVFSLVEDDDTVSTECTAILYRTEDAEPPIQTALWVPSDKVVVPNGETTAKINYGSSFKGQNILCVVSDSKGNDTYGWLLSDGKNTILEIEAPGKDERTYVTLIAYRDHVYHSKSITLIPAPQLEQLEIITETFRKNLEPGTEEQWKFRLEYGGEPVAGYAYALLYDKAMDAISPLSWNWHLFTPSYSDWIRTDGPTVNFKTEQFNGRRPNLPYYHQAEISFLTYGESFYGRNERRMYACSASFKSRIAGDVDYSYNTITSGAMADDVAEEAYDAEATAEAGGMVKEEIKPELRPIEMPVAFFMPDLQSDREGNVDIQFTVPNFNTTWKFLLGAYTTDLESGGISLECVATKKVMVKMLPPRFLRTGDTATITATIYNNSEKECQITGIYEIFDPQTDAILAGTSTTDISIRPSGSHVISLDFKCPDNLNALGLRVYARTAGASDGEQTVIPVLPASQPVVESDPFYLEAGQKEFKMTLPEFHPGSTVTFQYCDNPVWEVVTALPPIIEPESTSLTSQICALYANCVGMGLMKKSDNLRRGLEMIIEGNCGEGALESKLEKDSELKIVTLNNTPWVNDAKSETLRLSKLGTLLDFKENEKTIADNWEKIIALRNPDGGWSWCEGMKSSPWMTEVVLINLALLKKGNYLPELPKLETFIKEAITYVDGEYVDSYYKIKGNKGGFYRSMLPYLYTRSFFEEPTPSYSMRKISKEALDYLEKNWEKESIFTKATAAITLWRADRKMSAREILESLRQFASFSPEKGAWFDNLDSDWSGAGKLLTTARVLTAFHEIQPTDSIIDKMRQWLLLQKQTQDWQEGLWSIDAIDALLTVGSDWTGDSPLPLITINGEEIEQSEISKLTGALTVNIDAEGKEGEREISIRRESPSPAWGGFISQYIAPMADIKETPCTDLSIRKEIWKIIETENGTEAVSPDTLQIGDKVRISLIIDCGRDMDFVALTDQRAACLEPTTQLSGYAITDGLWCYKETRNSATNLFFDFLPRGKHIVTYECRVMEEGEFASGVAELQCLYSPLLTAHSAGEILFVK